jgi:23S rRNA pseudouridine955/2504/2580 synthase
MKEIIVTENESNQRVDRFMGKYLKLAGKGFVLKSIRKKYIKVNGKKTDPAYKLKEGDIVSIYLADSTVDKFSVKESTQVDGDQDLNGKLDIEVVYEDENILAVNKKPGVLTHGGFDSIVEQGKRYLIYNRSYNPIEEITFAPACCNRLDKNTSGIILIAKNNKALMETNKKIAERKVKKIYTALIDGVLRDSMHLKGYILKDKNQNKSTISDKYIDGSKYVETVIKPIKVIKEYTLVEINLITGRSHQIRAHLNQIKKPIIGDMKYGNSKTNKYFYKKFAVSGQMLHCGEMEIKDYLDQGKNLKITAPIPENYVEIIKLLGE